MAVMTAQLPLSVAPAGAIEVGLAAALVEDDDGGRVFLHGELVSAWDTGDEAGRRYAAVQLVRTGAAKSVDIAAGFGASRETLRRWVRTVGDAGVGGLVSDKRGPKGPSRVTGDLVAAIRARRAGGASLRAVAATVGVSVGSVRRALAPVAGDPSPVTATTQNTANEQTTTGAGGDVAATGATILPVLGDPAPRSQERALARWGLLESAPPVFTPAARVPLAGLLLAMPALEGAGLLRCAKEVYGSLPSGFYGLDTMLVEGVLRALAGEARAEGATRIDPVALGRVLGLDRAPEVKTIRRKIAQLAQSGKAGDLLAGMAHHHATRHADDTELGLMLYVDGHVRAYQGTRKVAKTHLSRLRFPAPATVETWVSDSRGDPVLVVMSEPGASLAAELRRLLPELRTAVGDDRRVLVGFDRGGWSPTLFAHMHAAGFDVLTWRKGTIEDLPATAFTDTSLTDEAGRTHAWHLADTNVELPIDDHGGVFTMRQVTRLDQKKKGTPTQVHVLTTRTDPGAEEVIYRMGGRWRLENYFRYARMHFDLDSHDSYASTDDDPDRMVPNPAKKTAHQHIKAARARYDRAVASTDAEMLAAHSPEPGTEALLTNADHDEITAELRAAETTLSAAETAHKGLPARVPLGEPHPGQQVLDVETKLISHAIRIAAFNTATTLARAIRINTGYARKNHEAHALARQALTQAGDIEPGNGFLTVRLDPMPTARATAAIRELCEHLTTTGTTYPGTNLTLRYEIKNQP